MVKIQKLLKEPYRVEVYNSHFTLYNYSSGTELDFDTEEELIIYLELL